ncbi:MAG: nickel-dependent hydrogenase large subunit, partial [Gammaproteobacteria bacterium]|nr:nickel-dependent hydrogenase large subunit [Gammaproteobacteria bacterium]
GKKAGLNFPDRNMFHSVHARALEILFAINESIEILKAYKETNRPFVEVVPRAGIASACTEAPRGILFHEYEVNSDGRILKATIVPPTSQNQARIEQDLRDSLNSYGLDRPDYELQLYAEKVIRNYDPCISCATHFLDLKINRHP